MPHVVTLGDIMLRLAPQGKARFSQANAFDARFGGSEANVAVSLANYGTRVEFVTCLPPNAIGKSALRELRRQGVGTHHVGWGGHRIGLYYFEPGAMLKAPSLIYDRYHSAFANWDGHEVDWDAIFRDASWFHWSGVTPAISAASAKLCRRAVRAANERGVPVSCDLNYRSTLWEWGKQPVDVMPELVEGCDLLMASEYDARQCLDAELPAPTRGPATSDLDVQRALEVCRALHERFPRCQTVTMPLRHVHSAEHHTWTGVLYGEHGQCTSRNFELTDIVDRLGAGDAYAGGLIHSLLVDGDDEQRALDFAVAASALKHAFAGDFNLAELREVEQLLDGNYRARVVR